MTKEILIEKGIKELAHEVADSSLEYCYPEAYEEYLRNHQSLLAYYDELKHKKDFNQMVLLFDFITYQVFKNDGLDYEHMLHNIFNYCVFDNLEINENDDIYDGFMKGEK